MELAISILLLCLGIYLLEMYLSPVLSVCERGEGVGVQLATALFISHTIVR